MARVFEGLSDSLPVSKSSKHFNRNAVASPDLPCLVAMPAFKLVGLHWDGSTERPAVAKPSLWSAFSRCFERAMLCLDVNKGIKLAVKLLTYQHKKSITEEDSSYLCSPRGVQIPFSDDVSFSTAIFVDSVLGYASLITVLLVQLHTVYKFQIRHNCNEPNICRCVPFGALGHYRDRSHDWILACSVPIKFCSIIQSIAHNVWFLKLMTSLKLS